MDEATTIIDNKKNEFNITGIINDKNFNYNSLKLTVNSNEESDKYYNISCNSINNNENKYTIKCKTKDKMKANLTGSFADLGNENLIVNFKDISSNSIDFSNKVYNNFGNNYKKKKKLSAGGIVAIIISSLVVITIIIALIFFLRKNPGKQVSQNSTVITQVSSTMNKNNN